MSQGPANLQQLLEVHSTVQWPVEKRSTCSSSDLLESGGRSLNGSNGICDGCIEHIQGGVWRQVHTLSYKRDIDGHQPVFALGFSSLAQG